MQTAKTEDRKQFRELSGWRQFRTGNATRWKICALLFFATTINYVDRHVLSILAPQLQAEMGWSEIDYSYIVMAFQAAYGLGVVGMGKLLDRFGTRVVYAVAVAVWSLAGMGHALARSALGFGIARFSLGIGEAANFPAAVKTVAEWFPERETGLANGLFNSGANIGVILAPLIVPWLALQFGWQSAFILTGALGFIWLLFWLRLYEPPVSHPDLSEAERAYIDQDGRVDTEARARWRDVVMRREALTIFAVRFLSDAPWWFLLFWLPKFLYERHGIGLTEIGPPLIAVYLVADMGSIAGGWLSSMLVKRGISVNAARKRTMLLCAIGVLPIVMASTTETMIIAVALISVAAACHTGWVANVYSVISDVFPSHAVGSVTGVSTLFAVLGGMALANIVGRVLEFTGNYMLIFWIASSLYLIAWIVLGVGIPKIERVAL